MDGAGENGTLGLLASSIGYDTTKFVDTLVDVPSSATFDLFLEDNQQDSSLSNRLTDMVVFPLPLPLLRANGGVAPSAGGGGGATWSTVR